MKFDIHTVGDDALAGVHEITTAELQAFKDRAAALRNGGHTVSKEFKLAASVPAFVVYDWCNKRGISHEEFMRNPKLADAFLNDPDNKAFRIWEGRV